MKTSIAWIGLLMISGAGTWAAEPPRAGELGKYTPTEQELRAAYQRSQKAGQASARIYKSQINPTWFRNNTHFWYRNDLRGGAKELILVDAERGVRGPAFDHRKLATAVSKAASAQHQPDRPPFDSIEIDHHNLV